MDEKEARRLFDESLAWAHSIAGDYAKHSIRHVEIKDVKQEAGIALWRAAETFDLSRDIPFRFYAKRCITNRLDSLYRAGQKQALEETSLDAAVFFDDVHDDTFKDQIPSPDVDAAREAHRAEVRRALAEGMGRLTPNQRDILEARSRGESYREIADRLGITKQAVEAASNRALDQMKSSVEAKGVHSAMFMPSVENESPKKSSGCAAVLLVVPACAATIWILLHA
jgi:RNA polymerase sigma factor (sigma-70 family)